MARVLSVCGCDVHEVGTGEAALVAVVREPFDAVVSEVDLRGPMDGAALWRAAVAERPELKNRFVFLSALGRLPVPSACLVTKPFHLSDLRNAVQSALRE